MKTFLVKIMIIGYLRVSTKEQEIENQKNTILNYTNNNGLGKVIFKELHISSRKSRKERLIDNLLEELNENDTLIITELSRIGRSVSEVTTIINQLIDKKVRIISIKENIDTKNRQDINTKVIITMFSLLAELERDLISLRTKEALRTREKQGIKLGRPKGTGGKSKLDKDKELIREYLSKDVSIMSISKILNVSYPTIYKYIKKYKLKDKVGV